MLSRIFVFQATTDCSNNASINHINRTDLPQALVLLSEMNVSVQHVASLVDNMIQRVRKGEMSTNQGLSFLEMKYNMLLSYLINLTYVVLRKCSGVTIEADPCIERLVEIRTVLEKIKPIDSKLKYQIDKLVKTTVIGGGDSGDQTHWRANPDSLNVSSKMVTSNDEEDDDSDDEDDERKDSKKEKGLKEPKSVGIYVPPKLSAVHYNEDENKQERIKKRALSSSIMQDLREEYLDIPLEVSQSSRAQHPVSKRDQEREEYEENYLTRLPVSKLEKQRHRHLSTVGVLGDEITDFGGKREAKKRKKKMSVGGRKKRKRLH